MPFPETWPLFTAKDKLGDWFEAYGSLSKVERGVAYFLSRLIHEKIAVNMLLSRYPSIPGAIYLCLLGS